MGLADTAALAVKLNLEGNFSQNLTTAGRNLDTFNSKVSNTARKVGQDLGHGVRNAARNIERLAFVAGGLALGGGAAAVKWAGDFQAGMQTINTVAFATSSVLAKAGEGLRETFRSTGQSMEDLQAAEYDLVSAGIALKDAQAGVNTAVKLGIGALGSTSEAVDVLTTAINSYNLKAKDGSVATATWTRLSDELAQAVADGKVKLSDIAATYARVAPLAANFGVKTGEIAAALGFLTARGNTAEASLTQMQRAITELIKPGPELTKVLEGLGTTGAKLIKKDGLAGALEAVRVEAQKLKIPFQDLFGRKEAYLFALQTTGPNAAGFAAELDRIGHSAGMTAKQFDERAQGFNYQLGVLKANVQDAGITIGTALLPRLTEMAQKVSSFLRDHQDDIKHFADDLAKGFEKAAAWAEKIDWSAIAGAARGLVGFGKGLAEAFMSMPADAKTLLLGLYGLNKLSGGAVVNIGVDLAKGGLGTLFNQFLGKGSIINPMYVVPLGGGLGVPGSPQSPTSALSSIVDTALKAAVITIPPLLILQDTKDKLDRANDPTISQADKYGGGNVGGLFGKLFGAPDIHLLGSPKPIKLDPRGLSEGNKEIVDALANSKDQMESMRIALASKQAATTARVENVARTVAGASSAIVQAIRANRPIINLKVLVSGDTARVTKNYQSGGTVTHGGRTGGQQEFG